MWCTCMGRDEFVRRKRQKELPCADGIVEKAQPALGPMEACYSNAHADSKNKVETGP